MASLIKSGQKPKDGFVGLFISSVPILESEPSISIYEVMERDGNRFISNAIIECSLSLLYGTITKLKVIRKLTGIPAITHLFGLTGYKDIEYINYDDTINVNEYDQISFTYNSNSIIYVFVNNQKSNLINQVQIGSTLTETMTNLYHAINRTNNSNDMNNVYYNVQQSNAFCFAKWITENCILLVAKNAGSYGNNIYVQSSNNKAISIGTPYTASGIEPVYYDYFYDGSDNLQNPEINISTFSVSWAPGVNSGIFSIRDIPYSPDGIYQKFLITMLNEVGESAVLNGIPYEYQTEVIFNGEDDDELDEYAAVLNLMCINANFIYGGISKQSPAVLPPNGIARLTWSDMTQYVRGLKNHPISKLVSGIQDKRNITARQLRNVGEYVIFMFVPYNNLNPEPTYPCPVLSDPMGNWVLCGRTVSNHFDIAPPVDKIVSFWVGFGTKKTLSKTSLYELSYKSSNFLEEKG